MYNGNTYKRFYTIMISLGVILSVGQFSYAHSPELAQAERTINENSPKEDLGRLYKLYKQDVHEHLQKGEENKAKKSKALAACINARIASIISKETSTSRNLANTARHWNKAADLFEEVGNDEMAVKATKKMAWTRAKQMDSLANDLHSYMSRRPITVGSLINWEFIAKLEELDGNNKKATLARAYGSYARAATNHYKKRTESVQKDWEDIAKAWDDAAECCEKVGCILRKSARFYAACVRLCQADRFGENEPTPDDYGNVAIYYETFAELEEKAEKFKSAASYRADAAYARAKQASIIADIDETIKNRENAERLWNAAAHLCEAAGKKKKAVEARKNAKLESGRKANAIAYKNMVYFLISNIDENSIEFESTPTLEHISKRPPLL